MHLVQAVAILASRAERARRFRAAKVGGVTRAVPTNGRGRRSVIVDGILVAGEQTDFTKDADVAARTRVGFGSHLGVSVRVVGVLLLAAAPEEKDDEGKKSKEGKHADDNSCNRAARETI